MADVSDKEKLISEQKAIAASLCMAFFIFTFGVTVGLAWQKVMAWLM